MSLKRIDDAFKIDSRRARLDSYPYACSDSVEAIAEALADIEEHSAVFGICGTDVGRNQPLGVGIRFHAFPLAKVSEFEANGLGAG